MDTALSRKELAEMLDAAVRKVTMDTAGVSLRQGGPPPREDSCTVHIAFNKGFRSSLSLRADTGMLERMTKNAIREEEITRQDLEDFAKEYFNVLCGRIAGSLYRLTSVASRFSVPAFHWGRFEPEGQYPQFALNYVDEQRRSAQLIHNVPLAGREDGAALKKPEFDKKENSNMKRIMVVDDSRMVKVQMEELLEGTEYEVASFCRSGEEAIERYGEVLPDLVTMDIIMPGMDGLETARAILEEHPEARIIMVSSLAYDDTFEEAQSIGAKGFIDKPFERERLLELLDQVLKSAEDQDSGED